MKIPKARKLPSGAWRCQVMIDGRRVSVTEATEKDCIARAVALKTKHAQAHGSAKTLRTAIDEYIASRINIRSPATIRGYRTIQNCRFQSVMDKNIYSITPQRWTVEVNAAAEEYSAKTVVNSWMFIASVLRFNGITPPNITMPQIVEDEHPFLEPEDIPVFIKAVHGKRGEIASLLALSSLRESEILALDWDNIDLKNDMIHVRGAVVPNEKNVFVKKKENKNTSSRRDVPILIPELKEALSDDYRQTPKPVTDHPSTIRRQINRICEQNGLPLVGVHGMRHSFASLCYYLKIDKKITRMIGGWKSDYVMDKIYTHLAKREIGQSVNDLKAYFTQNAHAT